MTTHYYAEEEIARAEALALTRSGYRWVAVTDLGNLTGWRWLVVGVH